MKDIGAKSAARSGGLTELARCNDTASERDAKRVLVNKYHLALEVEPSFLETGDPSLRIQC